MRLQLSRQWGTVLRRQLITLCCSATVLTVIAVFLFANQLCRLLEPQRLGYTLTSLILLLATTIVLLEISTGWTAVLYSLGALSLELLDVSNDPSRFAPLYRQLWASPGSSSSTDQSRPADLGHGLTMLSVTRQKHPEVLDE